MYIFLCDLNSLLNINRLLRLPLEISLFSADEAKAFLDQQNAAKLEQQGTRQLRTNRVTLADEFNKDNMRLPPPSTPYVAVLVTEVSLSFPDGLCCRFSDCSCCPSIV